MTARGVLSALAALQIASAAAANHPGPDLDRAMAEKAPAFEVIDQAAAPGFVLQESDGKVLRLADLDRQIVVVSFVTADCRDACAAQQAALAAVQERVNIAPMRDMVTFLTILPSADGKFPASLAGGFAPVNWRLLVPYPGSDDPADLSPAYAGATRRPDAGPMAYVIDRGGRFAAIFHGTDFGQLNMLLYINGLTNVHHRPEEPAGIWDRLMVWLG